MHARSALLLIALAYAPLGAAHHGWSEYDSSRTLTLSGKMLDSGYEHPHGHIRLEAPDKTWQVVLAPPSRMQQRGATADRIAPGKTCTVFGYPHTSDPNEARIEYIVLDGKRIELR